MTEPCVMCGTQVPAKTFKETEGFCSYVCASGGGFKADAEPKAVPKADAESKERQFCLRVQLHYDGPYCPYCYHNCLKEHGTKAHSRAWCDECGYNEDEEDCVKPRCATERPSSFDWCSKTQDHKHVDGPSRIVGQSWHGPVIFWNCIKCNYEFGNH